MRTISRYLICAACVALTVACSRGPGKTPGSGGGATVSPYVTDHNIVALASKVPFPLQLPARIPGDPQVVDATLLTPPGSNGPVRCGIGFGLPDHGVLGIVESNGGQDIPTRGASGQHQVDVDPARKLVGTAWTGGRYAQGKTQNVLQVTVNGVQVRLSSVELSANDLVQIARSLQSVSARKV